MRKCALRGIFTYLPCPIHEFSPIIYRNVKPHTISNFANSTSRRVKYALVVRKGKFLAEETKEVPSCNASSVTTGYLKLSGLLASGQVRVGWRMCLLFIRRCMSIILGFNRLYLFLDTTLAFQTAIFNIEFEMVQMATKKFDKNNNFKLKRYNLVTAITTDLTALDFNIIDKKLKVF